MSRLLSMTMITVLLLAKGAILFSGEPANAPGMDQALSGQSESVAARVGDIGLKSTRTQV